MVDRTDEEGHYQFEGKLPELACRHPSFEPGSDHGEKGCVLLQQFRRHLRGAVTGEGLLEQERGLARIADQPTKVMVDRPLDSGFRGRVGCEELPGAALVLVEQAVMQRRDQPVLGTEMVVDGSDAGGGPLAHFLDEAARLAELHQGVQGGVEDLSAALPAPRLTYRTCGH